MSRAHDNWATRAEADYQRLRLGRRVDLDRAYGPGLVTTDRRLADGEEDVLSATLPAGYSIRWADVDRPYALLVHSGRIVAVGRGPVLRAIGEQP